MNRDCPSKNNGIVNDAVGEGRLSQWVIDSGATSQMTPYREDLFDFEVKASGIEITIVVGKKLRLAVQETVRLTSLNDKYIKIMKVLYQGLDRRKTCAIASGSKIGKAYMLDREQEEARFAEYARTGSQWELWRAHMGHPSGDAVIKTQRVTNGTPTVGSGIETLCGSCTKGKQTVARFPSRSERKSSRSGN
ncbi:Polyprotein [Phytophthora palmivora]|uniref:Polyprotein n=1 Tax=Phytophthora palmivora TaxID=4796 RepID=A0A2P4YV19_9STRA|nr:Polyprotein [Phytophthora palmivora]